MAKSNQFFSPASTLPSPDWGIGLPTDIMQNILFGYHTTDEAEKFAKASIPAGEDYKKPLMITRLTADLLNFVTKGQQAEAEKLLKDNPTLVSRILSMKTQVTDCSGREFIGITPFQYALWARDRHMWALVSSLEFIAIQTRRLQPVLVGVHLNEI